MHVKSGNWQNSKKCVNVNNTETLTAVGYGSICTFIYSYGKSTGAVAHITVSPDVVKKI